MDMGHVAVLLLQSDRVSHAAACVALSPAERAPTNRDRLRRRSVADPHTTPSAGAALHVAHPSAYARSRAHDSAARHAQGGARLCGEARRLDRGAARTAAASGALCRWGIIAAARRSASHYPATGRARDRMDRERRQWPTLVV